MINTINPSYVVWLLALPSPIMAFILLVWIKTWVKHGPKALSSKSKKILILGTRQMIITSAFLSLWMTLGTTVIGFMLSKLARFTVELLPWSLAVMLTFLCWVGGLFLGQLIFVKIFGRDLYVREA